MLLITSILTIYKWITNDKYWNLSPEFKNSGFGQKLNMHDHKSAKLSAC